MAQAVGMPGRALLGDTKQGAQPLIANRVQPFESPGAFVNLVRNSRSERLDVALAVDLEIAVVPCLNHSGASFPLRDAIRESATVIGLTSSARRSERRR